MTSAFHVRQETSGPGLYDIDKVEFRVTQSRVKKLTSPDWSKLDRLLVK